MEKKTWHSVTCGFKMKCLLRVQGSRCHFEWVQKSPALFDESQIPRPCPGHIDSVRSDRGPESTILINSLGILVTAAYWFLISETVFYELNSNVNLGIRVWEWAFLEPYRMYRPSRPCNKINLQLRNKCFLLLARLWAGVLSLNKRAYLKTNKKLYFLWFPN